MESDSYAIWVPQAQEALRAIQRRATGIMRIRRGRSQTNAPRWQ